MSRRSGTVVLTLTVTVTVFVAAMAVVTNPKLGEEAYSSKVLEEARMRQNVTVVSVPAPLETDVSVLREEDIMAGKVSQILLEDQEYLGVISDKGAEYVGNKISDLEVRYSSDTYRKIEDGDKAGRAYVDSSVSSALNKIEAVSSAVTGVDGKVDAVSSEIQGMDGEVEGLKKEIESLKAELESVKSGIETKDQLLLSILSDKAFMDTLASQVSLKVGKSISVEELTEAVIKSASFNSEVTSIMDEYHKSLEEANPSSIPLPSFETKTDTEYSEEEYLEKRNEVRGNEIDKILSFLGY